jgi:A/G-specific adenine glycosylase
MRRSNSNAVKTPSATRNASRVPAVPVSLKGTPIQVSAEKSQPQRTQRAQTNHGELIKGLSKEMARFRRALLGWYDQNRRDLPWRRTRDPYAIWLSEIMLQQTRVAAVLDHYRIFLERFPNVAALAAASEDGVLAAWSGLGYYRRARMLHQCAREIVERNGGRFPENSEALQELPGIGRYTAAAIASIAFAEPVAVVDGNVERVLQRVTGSNLTARQCWERAEELLSKSRPGDFNQAMMELGATVCFPREPRCLVCPVRQWCVTQRETRQAASLRTTGVHSDDPPPRVPTRQNKREIWCALERRDGRVRLVKRPKKASLMAGMWELPQWAELPHASASEAHWRTFRHSITVTDYRVHVLRDWKVKGRPKGCLPARGEWVAIDKIPQLPITGLTRKVLKAGGII